MSATEFEPLSLVQMGFSAPSVMKQPLRAFDENPLSQLAIEFGLYEVNEIEKNLQSFPPLFAVCDSRMRAAAAALLLELRGMQERGATPNEIYLAGRSGLKNFQATSSRLTSIMQEALAECRVEDLRYASFDKRAAEPPFTVSFGAPIGYFDSSLMGLISKSGGEAPKPSFFASLFAKVDQIFKDTMPLPTKKAPETLEERKAALTLYIKHTDPSKSKKEDAEFLNALSQGLNAGQKKELYASIPKAIVANAIDTISAPFTLVSRAIKSAAVMFVKGAVNEACSEIAMRDSAQFKQCVKEVTQSFKDTGDEVSRRIKEEIPKWMKKAIDLLYRGKEAQYFTYMSKQARQLQVEESKRRLNECLQESQWSNPGQDPMSCHKKAFEGLTIEEQREVIDSVSNDLLGPLMMDRMNNDDDFTISHEFDHDV